MKREEMASKNSIAEGLISRFAARDATIGVIGLGYVGLPLLCRFAEAGFRTLGLDIDQRKVDALAKGQSYLATVSTSSVQHALDRGMVSSSDYRRANEADALIICVPTPLT